MCFEAKRFKKFVVKYQGQGHARHHARQYPRAFVALYFKDVYKKSEGDQGNCYNQYLTHFQPYIKRKKRG